MKVIYGPLQLTQKWKDEVISLDYTGQSVINVTPWLSRMTLDIIGEGMYVLWRDVAITGLYSIYSWF